MVSRIPGSAIYKQIVDQVREQIFSGELPPGTPLGSEAAMVHRWQVGIGTVRRVTAALKADGLIETAPGQVARVAEQPEAVVVCIAAEVDPTIRARRATPEERRQLDLAEGVWVIEVTHGGMSDLYDATRTEIRVIR